MPRRDRVVYRRFDVKASREQYGPQCDNSALQHNKYLLIVLFLMVWLCFSNVEGLAPHRSPPNAR